MISEHQSYAITATNVALGSSNSWYGLNKWPVIAAANPALVTLDGTNDTAAFAYASMEALIRKIWTANPNTRLIGLMLPKFSDNSDASVETPINLDYMDAIIALYERYGIPYIDYWTALKALISAGHHLNEYYAVGDAVHPLEPGHNLIFSLVEPYLPDRGAVLNGSLPTRVYDNGDLENDRTVILGTANGGTTGTWGTSGTQISSSEVGATATFSATCKTFGLWRADELANNIQYQVDGGDWVSVSQLGKVGTALSGDRSAHTIVVKVASGTVKIDEFWAI